VNSKAQNTENNDAIERPEVCLIPGRLFFVEHVEVPDVLETKEINGFAELSLESISPFPIEQLYWGYLYKEGAQQIILYASHRDRLKQEGFTDLEQYVWVLPDFATLAGAYFAGSTAVHLKSGQQPQVLLFDSGNSVPKEINPSSIPDKADHLDLYLDEIILEDNGLPVFTHYSSESRGDEAKSWSRVSPNEHQLWQSDIRPVDFKQAEQRNRQLSSWVTRALNWAAILALVFIVAELGLLGANFWQSRLQSQIDGQRSTVATIQDRQSLMNKLDQVAQNELRPIDALDALNQLKPNGIYFDSTDIEGANHIKIDGVSSTISELNNYIETLRRSGSFEIVTSPKSITRSGETTFSVTVGYNYVPDETAESSETPEADEVEAASI